MIATRRPFDPDVAFGARPAGAAAAAPASRPISAEPAPNAVRPTARLRTSRRVTEDLKCSPIPGTVGSTRDEGLVRARPSGRVDALGQQAVAVDDGGGEVDQLAVVGPRSRAQHLEGG